MRSSTKPFHLHSLFNLSALQRGAVELRGHRIPLPGVISYEPLMRGSDQRQWLEQLSELGIRHVLVPLNGREEDTSLYARRHPDPPLASAGPLPAAPPAPALLQLTPVRRGDAPAGVVYDLRARDEGIFARLQFLLDAADKLGVLVGLSLFSADYTRAGPFRRGANSQGLSLADALEPSAEATSVESALNAAADWIAAEVRTRSGVWMEIFRGVGAGERDNPAFGALHQRLTRRVLAVLQRPSAPVATAPAGKDAGATAAPAGKDAGVTAGPLSVPAGEPAGSGPWVVLPPGYDSSLAGAAHLAPFGVRAHQSAGVAPVLGARNRPGEAKAPALWRERRRSRRPMLCQFLAGGGKDTRQLTRGPQRAALWREVMRGGWPLVACGLRQQSSQRQWNDLAQIATFARQWAASGYLRPCPEMLLPSNPARETVGEGGAGVPGRGVSEGTRAGTPAPPRRTAMLRKPLGADCLGGRGRQALLAATDGWGRYFVYASEALRAGLTVSVLPGTYRYYWFDPASGRGLDHGEGLEGGPQCRVPAPGSMKEALLVLEQEELPDPMSVW